MKNKTRNNGSVILIVIFAVAMLSTIVAGILQLNTEELQVMQNQVYATQAWCVAEAGLSDAYYELRSDSSWNTGFTNKSFNDGSYSVTVTGTTPSLTVESTGISQQGYVARLSADLTLSASSPYTIRVDKLRVNE